MLAVSGYGHTENRITYSLVGGGTGAISTNDVDWTTTTRLNAQRGVRVTLHNSRTDAGGVPASRGGNAHVGADAFVTHQA